MKKFKEFICRVLGHYFVTFVYDDPRANKTSIVGCCRRCGFIGKFYDLKEEEK